MGKTSIGNSNSTSHMLFKDKARNRIDDLQGMFKDLQSAMKESRRGDVAVLEEQMNQMLNEWKAELNEPSPASSQNEGSLGSLSADLLRFLVEDDATSELTPPTNPNPESETNTQSIQLGEQWNLEVQDYFVNEIPSSQEFHEADRFEGSFLEQQTVLNSTEVSARFDHLQYNLCDDIDSDGTLQCGESVGSVASNLMYTVDPPFAFLGPKCALWDCARPAKRLEGHEDYCNGFHADLAKNEGPYGTTPVMRHGGIDFKDDLLFAALIAKTHGKDVGVPECEGAATTKFPWNTPELFDLVLEGERRREWLFFDKPGRLSESGNRKQKSQDYSGRGWRESRKQTVKELGGVKKSYYMNHQPLYLLELHLYVYEIKNADLCALYRLELKLVDGKKSPKGKVSPCSLTDLQKQDTRVTTESPTDGSQSFQAGGQVSLNGVEYFLESPNQKSPTNESCLYGDYSVYQTPQEHVFQGFDHYKDSPEGLQYPLMNNFELTGHQDYQQFDLHEKFEKNSFEGFVGTGKYEEDNKYLTSDTLPSTCHSSSPFIRRKCALWDCSRPAQGSDYCCIFHGTLAVHEGPLSMTPVLRPGGISLNDGPLFTSLSNKIQGKDVGIPECEGAAINKSPWKAPELFDASFFEGETLREWLFFDKPRKAFEGGKRRQRSLPDHSGRGWHESRKQVMDEYGGVKKSYYMDPQPLDHAEWHLYEYIIDNCDALILCRLDFKIVLKKKSPRGKVTGDPIDDLQNQMGRLNAEASSS